MIRSRRTKIALACSPFALCALVALSYPVAGWLGRREVKLHLAELEGAGYAVDVEKYYVSSENPDDDVFQHPAVIRELKESRLRRVFDREPEIPGLARRKPRTDQGLVEGTDLRAWFDPPAADEETAAEKLLSEIRDTITRIEAVRPALTRPDAAWPVTDGTNFFTGQTGIPNVISGMFLMRDLATIEAELGVIYLANNDADRAAGCVFSMLEICRLCLDSRPSVVSLLIAEVVLGSAREVWWEGVRRASWSADQIARFDAGLAALDPQASASRCFRGEVAFARWEAEQLLTTQDEIGADGDLAWKEGWEWDRKRIVLRGRAIWRQVRPQGLELMQTVEADRIFYRHASESDGVPRTRFTADEMRYFQQRCDDSPEAYFTDGSWYTQQKDIDAGAWKLLTTLATRALQMEARIALIRGGLALEKYRLLEGGHPTTLADLVPGFIEAVPTDPFDGNPLRYRRQADGSPQLWSIGPDLRDEGGLPHRDVSKGDMVWITRPIPGFTKRELHR